MQVCHSSVFSAWVQVQVIFQINSATFIFTNSGAHTQDLFSMWKSATKRGPP